MIAEWDVSGRGAGKTYRLVQWTKQSRRRGLIVPTTGQARAISLAYDVPNKQVRTFDQLRNDQLRGSIDEVAIDDLHQVINLWLPAGVSLAHVAAHGVWTDENIAQQRREIEVNPKWRELYEGQWLSDPTT